MIEEQQILEFMREKAYKPLTFTELAEAFSVGEEEIDAFQSMIDRMEKEGKVVQTRARRFGVPERFNLVRGVLQGHPKGFGFVVQDRPNAPDIYVHPNDMNGAMDGDTVLVRLQGGKKVKDRRPEGEIVRILKRGRNSVVGTFTSPSSHFGFVIPDDKRLPTDIFIPPEARNGAKQGDKVVVELRHIPDSRFTAEGVVTEVLGHKDDPGVDILSIIRKYQLPETFPEEVLAEAEQIPTEIDPAEIEGRRDLRDRTMVTIDGEDAKDLDDAVSVERLSNGNIRLGVHIADVSYYVKEGSALDREAYARGTSVYLVDRVIPMLPPRLSNGICSLNPQVDRLTLTCDMEIDSDGNVVSHDIYPSVIRTNERMTYTAVKRILEDEDPELIERYAPLVDDFRLMADLARTLRKKRLQRGAIDFNFTEAKIKVDENGKPVEIVKRPRTIAEQLIEEFMLCANETVAEHFAWADIPFLYRIHENPDAEKLQAFYDFITHFGYSVKGRADKVKPRALQQLLEKISGKPEETLISTVLLRSMKQARYAAECTGHFGLAATFYCHFTSPIRRYPDLVIHRIIREVLANGTLSSERITQLKTELPDIAQQSSVRERIAVEAERETDNLKKAEFMLDKIGQEFDGIISGVTSFGIFVELDNTVEGLVHISYMTDDYYHYDEQAYCLVGERTGNIFRIGDRVRVRVAGVNIDEHKVDFELVADWEDGGLFDRSQSKRKKRKKEADSETGKRREKKKKKAKKAAKKVKKKKKKS